MLNLDFNWHRTQKWLKKLKNQKLNSSLFDLTVLLQGGALMTDFSSDYFLDSYN